MKKVKLLFTIALMFIITNNVIARELISTIDDLTKTHQSGEELVLDADITLSAHAFIENVTLDLNGHTLNTSGYVLVPKGDVTLKDSSSAKTGKIFNNTNAAVQQVQVLGNFVFDSGTIEAKDGFGIYAYSGKTIMNGGVISSEKNNSVFVGPDSSFEMNGGKIEYSGTTQAVQLGTGASVIINDGEINSPSGRGIVAFKKGYVEINGGKIVSAIQALTGNGSTSGANEGTGTKFKITGGILESSSLAVYAPQPEGETIITGGTIKGKTGIEIRAGKLNVSGGEIISNYIPTESEKNGNGSTTNGAAIAVVQHRTKLPIEVNITDGYFEAYTPFIQQNVEENEQEAVDKISIKIEGGTFNTIAGDENNIPTASVYSENFEKFISGGAYSKKPDLNYIVDKLNAFKLDEYYYVIDNIMFVEEDSPIAIISDKAYTADHKLEVIEIKDDTLKEATGKVEEKFKINKKLKDTKLLALYDISLKDGQGQVVEVSDGKLKVYVEIDESLLKYDHYKVLYFDENGEIKEEIDAKIATEILGTEIDEKNILEFETSHLSTYGVIGYNDVKEENPATLDKSGFYIIIGLISLCAIGLIIRKVKKQYN